MEKLSDRYEALKNLGNRVTRFVCGNFESNKAMFYWNRIGMHIEPKFTVTPKNMDLYMKLIYYINGLSDFDGDLNKGIGLHGNPGSGKTLAMQIMASWIELDNVKFMKNGQVFSFQFEIISSREIVEAFNDKGYDGLNTYTMRNVLCIDDLGSESLNASYYGNKVNVIEHLIEQRYFYNKLTHYTTNLDKEDFIKVYGDRVYSRISGTVNSFVLACDDWRIEKDAQHIDN